MLTIDDLQFNYSKSDRKFFEKHLDVREEFRTDVLKVLNCDHAEQVNYKQLQGKFKGYSRIAIGGYRVIYRIINGEVIIVDVVAAGSRGDIYKSFRG